MLEYIQVKLKNDYVYSTNTGEYDVLVNTFEEFKHAIFLVHLGVSIYKVLEVLHAKYPVHNLSS